MAKSNGQLKVWVFGAAHVGTDLQFGGESLDSEPDSCRINIVLKALVSPHRR